MSNARNMASSKSDLQPNQALASIAVILSCLSLAVSAVGVYYARSQSPFHFAQPHQLSFWTIKSNTLTEDQKPQSGRLLVLIKNDSDTPAREILVVVSPISAEPKIGCNAIFNVQDGAQGTRLVKVDRVPANSTIELTVDDNVTEYPRTRSSHGYYRQNDFAYSADIADVQTEFGTIKKDFSECKENYSVLSNDEGARTLQEFKEKLAI